MLNAIDIDPDVEVVDVDNGERSIILLLSTIEKGNVTRTDQIQYFVEHFGTRSCSSFSLATIAYL